jgi:hypothetical protein
MVTLEVIRLAQSHLNNGAVMASSALSCCEDAMRLYVAGNDKAALMWSVKSLAYSVGVFHADHKVAQAAYDAFLTAEQPPVEYFADVNKLAF